MAEQLHVLHALQVNIPLMARVVLIVTRVNTQAVVDQVHVRHVQLANIKVARDKIRVTLAMQVRTLPVAARIVLIVPEVNILIQDGHHVVVVILEKLGQARVILVMVVHMLADVHLDVIRAVVVNIH